MAAPGDEELEAELRRVAQPLVDTAGVELLEVTVKGYPGSRKVRLVVDADGGVSVDTCAQLSRHIGDEFDDRDLIKGGHTLEVSTPGVDRPLVSERDFARNVGREVAVIARLTTHEETGQQPSPRQLVGTIAEVDAGTLILDVNGENVRVALASVEHGRLQLPW